MEFGCDDLIGIEGMVGPELGDCFSRIIAESLHQLIEHFQVCPAPGCDEVIDVCCQQFVNFNAACSWLRFAQFYSEDVLLNVEQFARHVAAARLAQGRNVKSCHVGFCGSGSHRIPQVRCDECENPDSYQTKSPRKVTRAAASQFGLQVRWKRDEGESVGLRSTWHLLEAPPTANLPSATICPAIAPFGGGMPFVVAVVPRFKMCGASFDVVLGKCTAGAPK